jgi:hypothetical protein
MYLLISYNIIRLIQFIFKIIGIMWFKIFYVRKIDKLDKYFRLENPKLRDCAPLSPI